MLEISALLLVIVLPLAGPKKKKTPKVALVEISNWAIDENGGLQNFVTAEPHHHQAK